MAGVLFIIVRTPAPGRRREPPRLSTMWAGVGYIWRTPVVLGAISLDLFATLLGGATALLPIYARDILHDGSGRASACCAPQPAVGALMASVVLISGAAPRHAVGRTHVRRRSRVFGIATIVFGAIELVLRLSLVALVVLGAADMVSVVIRHVAGAARDARRRCAAA